MRLDIYRRAERDGMYSYLAVPEGRTIPGEATGTDWQREVRALEVGDAASALPDYHIDHPVEQIAAKGYAITGLKELQSSAGSKH